MTKYLLDTNIVSYFVKGHNEALNQKILATPPSQLCTNWTVKQELYFGVFRVKRLDLELRYNQFFEYCKVVFPDDRIVLTCAKIEAHLISIGKIVCLEDIWIASTCIVSNFVLVTNNTKDFVNIPELKFEDWTK